MKAYAWTLILLFLLATLPAHSSPIRPRVTLIVCPSLTYQRYFHSPLRLLSGEMAVGLLSPGEPRKPNPVANLYATLYAGDTANTKNPHRDLLFRAIATAGDTTRVKIVTEEDTLDAWLDASARLQRGERVVICGFPPVSQQTHEWNTLSVVLISSLTDWGDESLTSATTQTDGLVALRDIAPSVLAYAGLPIPQSMAGHVITKISVSDSALAGMDRLANLNQVILLPTMWAYGWIAGIALLSTLWTLSKGIVWAPGLQRYLLRVMMSAPLALMLAALTNPHGAWTYGASIIGISIVAGLIPSAGLLMAATTTAIVVDGFLGSPAVARSALSGYWISGIRFYGIGNEYMGILIGSALVASIAAAKHWPDSIRRPIGAAALALAFAAIVFVLSYPAFGAKAGGAVTAMTAFVPAWLWLTRRTPVTARACIAAAVAGFALDFVWAAIAHATGARETHIQAAAAHAKHGDIAYIWHIALRKAKLAIATATVPGVIVTYIGLIPVWLLWLRTPLKERVRDYLARDTAFGGLMRAGIAASVAALLFNDSGFVAFIFLFNALCFTLMHEMLGIDAGLAEAGGDVVARGRRASRP